VIRSTKVKIRMTHDWLGIPKGTKLIARVSSFVCKVLEGDHVGKEIGKAKYKVIDVLPDPMNHAGTD
jgi:hypothetical protein